MEGPDESGDRRPPYVGRLAPTPSGYLHIGHARTFWVAQQRADAAGGALVLRIEDLDGPRCKPHYRAEMMDDLTWFGFQWSHGPPLLPSARSSSGSSCSSSSGSGSSSGSSGSSSDGSADNDGSSNAHSNPKRPKHDHSGAESSGLQDLVRFSDFFGESLAPFAHVYEQRGRMPLYRAAWRRLVQLQLVYPSPHSRKDVLGALSAPHEGDEEVIFPPTLRPPYMHVVGGDAASTHRYPSELLALSAPDQVNWRFRVPDGDDVAFTDGHMGPQSYRAGRDFGDFVVWRADGFPSYELAVVVDDLCMGVTEVVRGADLLLSTARQLLLFRALTPGLLPVHDAAVQPPAFYHCDLVRDPTTHKRLAKRMQTHHAALQHEQKKEQQVEEPDDAFTLQALRAQGWTPERIRTDKLQLAVPSPPPPPQTIPHRE